MPRALRAQLAEKMAPPRKIASKGETNEMENARTDTQTNTSWTLPISCLGALIAYCAMNDYGMLHGAFTGRDVNLVLNNKLVQGNATLADFWSHDVRGEPLLSSDSTNIFRPISTLSFRANALWSHSIEDTYWYHLTNLGLHVLATFLVGLVVGAVVFGPHRPVAALGSTILFALHPVHAEAVGNVSGREDLLLAVFYLLGFLWYASFAKSQSTAENFLGHLGTAVFGFLATFSHEAGVMLGVSVSLYELGKANSSSHQINLKNLGVTAVWTGVIGYARTQALGVQLSPGVDPVNNPIGHIQSDPMKFFLSTSWLYCLQVREIFWTDSYSLDWSGDSISAVESLSDWRCKYIILLWSGLAASVILSLFKSSFREAFFIVFGSLTLAPFLVSSNLLFPAEFTKADHILYLPSIGACIVYGSLLELLMSRCASSKLKSVLVQSLAAGMLLLWLNALYHRSTLFSSPLRVWQTSFTTNSGSHAVRVNAAQELRQIGAFAAAEKVLRPLVGPDADTEVLTLYGTISADMHNCSLVHAYLHDAVMTANDVLGKAIESGKDFSKERRILSNLLTAQGLCMTLVDIPAAGKVLYAAAVADPTNLFATEQGSNLLHRVNLMKIQANKLQQHQLLQAQVKNIMKNANRQQGL